jgi:hypothetical protein
MNSDVHNLRRRHSFAHISGHNELEPGGNMHRLVERPGVSISGPPIALQCAGLRMLVWACFLSVGVSPAHAMLALVGHYQDYVLIDSSSVRALYVEKKWLSFDERRVGSMLVLYRSARFDPLGREFWSRTYSVELNCLGGAITASGVRQGQLDGMYDGMPLKNAADVRELDEPRVREAVCRPSTVEGHIDAVEPLGKFGTLKGLSPGAPAEQLPPGLLRSCNTVPKGRRTGTLEYVAEASNCEAVAPFDGSAGTFGSLGGVAIEAVRISICDRKLVAISLDTVGLPVATKTAPGRTHQLIQSLLEAGHPPATITFSGATHPASLVSANWHFSDWRFAVRSNAGKSSATLSAWPYERMPSLLGSSKPDAWRSAWDCTRPIDGKSDFK